VQNSERKVQSKEEKHPCLRFALCTLHFALILLLANAVRADDPTPLPNFVRFDEDGHGGGKMQTAWATYVDDDGTQVTLLSTMHIGDKPFFRTLAKEFPKYDAVLYELVAPRGVPPTEEGVNDQQAKIADDCDLDNQGPHMDYERENFVHADLTLEEIKKLEIARNGTFEGALGEGPGIKAAKDKNDTAGDEKVYNDVQSAKKMNPAEKTRLLRRAYSRILAVTAQPAEGKTFPEGMEVLVGKRNDEVIRVLNQQTTAGKKNIAIFYGAAHMVDMEHRLLAMGFKRKSLVWQTTWDVADDGTPTTRKAK
jgi:hypothetical protein